MLLDVEKWLLEVGISVNGSKSLTMIFDFSRCPLPEGLEFFNAGEPIPRVETMKVLGFHIHNKLKWDIQVNEMVVKASKRVLCSKA